MPESYSLDIWEPSSCRCEHCGERAPLGGGSWQSIGERKTRRGIVALANRSLSTGFHFRIQERHSIKGWRTTHMLGVKGYG